MAIAGTETSKHQTGGAGPAELDPITLAVLNKRFEAVTTKMANTLLRTGRSGVLNLARDFSTSVVTRRPSKSYIARRTWAFCRSV